MFKRQPVTVIVATRRVDEVLPHLTGRFRVQEALTTGGVYQALSQAGLVILDGNLMETEITRSGLLEALQRARVAVVSPDEFLCDPATHLARLHRQRSRRPAPLTPLRVALVSLSGGVGCTTLAWTLARYAVGRHHATAALVELTWGNGALAARLGLDGDVPDLYRVTYELSKPVSHESVTVVPIGGRTVHLLFGNPEQVESALDALAREHVLLVVDAHAAHPLWPAAREVIDRVLVVTDARPDAVENARLLLEDIGEKAALVVNRAGAQERLALVLAGQRACVVPQNGDAGRILTQFLYG